MRVGDSIPEVGSTFEWDIDEIMERWSHDLMYNFDGARVCDDCGDIFGGEWIGSWEADCHHEGITSPIEIEYAWSLTLSEKREDEWYDDVVISLSREGFTAPLTAYERDGNLILCDGHHRLAAARELGIPAVPVRVCGKFTCAEDSGEWRLADEEDVS